MPRERAVEVLLRGGGFEQSMSVFALVHGSCQDAWVWHKVIPLLRAGGHRVVAMDLPLSDAAAGANEYADAVVSALANLDEPPILVRSEEHTSELQSLTNLVCRLLLEKKK